MQRSNGAALPSGAALHSDVEFDLNETFVEHIEQDSRAQEPQPVEASSAREEQVHDVEFDVDSVRDAVDASGRENGKNEVFQADALHTLDEKKRCIADVDMSAFTS